MAQQAQPLPRNQSSQQQIVERREAYQGLIPPPVILQQFDDLIPGTAARIIQWAEDEQHHRQAMEREAQLANIQAQQKQLDIAQKRDGAIFRSDLVGQVLGFIVCAICVAGSIALALNNHDAAAGALAVIPTAAIIQAFRAGVFSRRAGANASDKK